MKSKKSKIKTLFFKVEFQLCCPSKSVFHLKVMKAFGCSLNVKLWREKLYCVITDFNKCKPSPNYITFVYLPMGHIWIDVWELWCFLSPHHTKNDCLQRKSGPQSPVKLHLVVLISHHPYGVQRSKYKILYHSSISELLSACSNTF